MIKPAVYLAALEKPNQFTLAHVLSDGPVEVKGSDGKLWQPKNFDRKNHGSVLLHKALAKSYNQATARLGMQVGIDEVLSVVERLGVKRKLPAVPALMLGAGSLSPVEVAQMYQTMAGEGVSYPLRSITEITDSNGGLLARYPTVASRAVEASVMHLLHYSMMEVVREGTGRGVYQSLADDFAVAGKTGTTNDLRDSWFAGFSGDYLAVVWLGRDDNKSAGLTGASGALKIWRHLFAAISREPINLEAPPGIAYHWIDSASGLRSRGVCHNARYMPFIQGSAPSDSAQCETSPKGVWKWFRNLF